MAWPQRFVGSEDLLQASEFNPGSRTREVSIELCITHFNLVRHLMSLTKCLRSCRIMPHLSKIFHIFWLIFIFLCFRKLNRKIYKKVYIFVYEKISLSERMSICKHFLCTYFFVLSWVVLTTLQRKKLSKKL